MKISILFLFISILLLSIMHSMAQGWTNGGNALTVNGTFGTTTNFSVLFKTANSERGRVTNSGLWGFGTTTPNSRVHINGASAQNPLRVQANGSTKFLVHSDGGVSIGGGTTPPANGLFVAGNTGIGTATPDNTLHVFKGSAGNVTGYRDAPLIVENATHAYVNILAPNDFETGVLFGRPGSGPSSNADGGIIYNSAGTPSGLQFRTAGNHTRMILDQNGRLGINTLPGFYTLKIIPVGGGGFDLQNAVNNNDWELFPSNDESASALELVFNGNFRGSFNASSGAYSAISDERLKTGIKPMTTMLGKIMQLKPATYQFKNATDKQEYNGFIAQEVMKLFPSMVSHMVSSERKLDVYTMDYSQFGVLAIKGIQELAPVIEEQKEKIALLEERLNKLEAALVVINTNQTGLVSSKNNALLEQNKPNPFSASTIIQYRVPQGSKAQLTIYDQTGKVVQTLNATESGQSQFRAQGLAAGIYTYTLTVDNSAAFSKQMLIIK